MFEGALTWPHCGQFTVAGFAPDPAAAAGGAGTVAPTVETATGAGRAAGAVPGAMATVLLNPVGAAAAVAGVPGAGCAARMP
jgi:hypothetical protein